MVSGGSVQACQHVTFHPEKVQKQSCLLKGVVHRAGAVQYKVPDAFYMSKPSSAS